MKNRYKSKKINIHQFKKMRMYLFRKKVESRPFFAMSDADYQKAIARFVLGLPSGNKKL